MPVTLSINDTPITAETGMTVLEAAKTHGIYVPTLCYLPKLKPFGGCRLCVVEIENLRGFPTACTVTVSEGMVVRTETDALRDLRRETLALILSEHPYSCLSCGQRAGCNEFQGTIRKAAVTTGCQYCPKNGQCELQKLVEYLDLKDIPYPIAYRGLPVEKDDPFFDRDYNLCILCGRCVRVCQEVRHSGVLSFTYRGAQAIVGTAFGRSHLEADCQFCGACVDVCPTGALADKRGKWEGVPDAIVQSVCPYCSVGCAVNVQVKNGQVIRAVGNDDGLTNDGELCVRGRFGVVDVVHSLSRLKAPLVRRNGRMVEVSWSEALDTVAQGLGQYTCPGGQCQGRADKFALVTSATATNEENYVLQKFARTVMGSNNVTLAADFPEASTSASPTSTGMELIGTLKATDSANIRDVRDAACVMVIGANVFDSHPVLGLEIRHALSRGARLITVDARQTKMAQQSSAWLQPKVGTDHVLLAGIIKVMLKAAGSGTSQRRPTTGTTAVVDGQLAVVDVDLAHVAEVTGVKQEAIVEAARLLAERTPAIIIYGSGVTHYSTAMDVVKAIRSLAFTIGDARIIGVPGEGNLVGAHDMGAHPALLPGYRPVSDVEARATLGAAWNTELDPAPGRNYESILAGIRQGQIKALYLAGEMPPLPELADLPFLVVQNIVPTEAAQYAHVILPATTFAEMDGTLTNLEGRVQLLRQAIQPVGQSRPGWMIVRDVAKRMGADWNYESAADVMTEIAALVPAYVRVNDEMGIGGVLRRFEPAAQAQFVPFSLDGIPYPYGHLRQSEGVSAEFPLTLITERNLFYYHGACLTEEVTGMNLIKNEEILHLNPADAARLGVADGALVKVVSPHGSAECIARATGGMPEGTVFTSVNHVTGSPLFPAMMPRVKACGVRIEA